MISRCWYCSGRVHKSRAVYEGEIERGRDCDLRPTSRVRGRGTSQWRVGVWWADLELEPNQPVSDRLAGWLISVVPNVCRISDTVHVSFRGLTLHPFKRGFASVLSCGSSLANTGLRCKIFHSDSVSWSTLPGFEAATPREKIQQLV